MSKIKLDANASGTGVFTIASPNSDTDRTLTLPEKSGTVHVGSGIDDNASNTTMTLDSSGNVGVGISSSLGAKLHVDTSGAGLIVSNTTTKVRIDSDGVKFGSDTAAANALDDYEEGTWTPQMLGYAQSTPASQTYSAQEGHYVKIGRLVVASYAVQFSNKGNMSGNYVLLAGWPFSRESANFDCGISYFNSMSTSVNSMWWELTNSYGWLAYVQTSGNTASTYMTASGISNSTRISGSVAYLTP